MNIEAFTLKLFLLFLPGIIALKIIELLTPHKKSDFNRYIINVAILGISSYIIQFAVLNIFSNEKCSLTFFDSLLNNTKIDFKEIFYSVVSATIIGIFFSLVVKKNWFYRFFLYIGITNRFGGNRVFDHLMNSTDVIWITIRDQERKLNYQGWVEYFNDNEDSSKEIFLREVIAFDNITGEKVSEFDSLYFPKFKDDYILEIHLAKEKNEENDKEEKNE
ncbi:MAG: hypothetical protein CVV02_01645 [Firmicutes bacterium HGW-Firmicutes-7]|nr:MAG: hypothetical protein CVV02_01645 [Firmicutes bacterium HGW-Firmicutes-7]